LAEAEVNEAQRRARKIDPRYTQGDLVRVAGGRNQAEAELIQNLLLEEGIPSILRRTRGFDVPDFLAAGPRDVLVPQSGHEAAHSLLFEAELVSDESGDDYPGMGSPSKLAAGVLIAVLLAGLLVWALYRVSL
jgi:hypothetical protein